MPDTIKKRPADGGSYKHTKDGYQRLDKPQQPNPGKTARRKAKAKDKPASDQSAGKSQPANVRELRGKNKE